MQPNSTKVWLNKAGHYSKSENVYSLGEKGGIYNFSVSKDSITFSILIKKN
jgi:hypothetical protein